MTDEQKAVAVIKSLLRELRLSDHIVFTADPTTGQRVTINARALIETIERKTP